MRFADCEVSVREKNVGKTLSEVQSLEMFIPFAPDKTVRIFTFDQYEIQLKGIPEDFKVIFIYNFQGGREETIVGTMTFGATCIQSESAYQSMMWAIKSKYITF
jgi:hypothetical protein